MAVASTVSMKSMRTRVLSQYSTGILLTNRVMVYITSDVIVRVQVDVPSAIMNNPSLLRSVPASDVSVMIMSSTRMVSVTFVSSVFTTVPVLMVIPHGMMLTE